ncbi:MULTISPECIES: hypothetical protein [Methanocalculus]|uniref:hypothetical protein n=1 Tax=Methanocalculus TaxID=71151 RepID=UPI00209D2A14|nr:MULTISPECIES: hypothetical protein [unclassified Methanocalculus]MCP1663055.1 hypothetical protein [Methanocalculus sp. AMF5]
MKQHQVPGCIIDFISLYCAGKSYRTVLYPWIDNPDILPDLWLDIPFEQRVAITNDDYADAPDGVRLIRGDSIQTLAGCSQFFDLILCFPPRETGVISGTLIAEDTSPIDIHDAAYTIVIFSAALRLQPKGALFAVVYPSFLTNGKHIHLLNRLGLFCEAALSIPQDGIPREMGKLPLLLIIRKGACDQLMAGELGPDRFRQEILLGNLATRTNGKKPELGIFVPSTSFRSLEEIRLDETIRRLAEEHGTAPVPFSGITKSISIGACGTLQDAGRRLYLPLSPDDPPVTTADDLTGMPDEAACILLRQSVADPAYLCHFFDTELGRAIRRRIMMRADADSDIRELLAETEIYLPPPQVQAEVIRIDTLIDTIMSRLSDIRKDLLEHPYSTQKALERLEQLKGDDSVADWIEELPFPLASILWAYIAESSPSKKVAHLFHFFEAAAELNSGILLSMLEPSARSGNVDLLDDNPAYRGIYLNATFRSWIILSRRAARLIRRESESLWRGDGELSFLIRANRDFLSMVTSKRLFALLDEVADLRNDWKGHGGIVGEKGYEERLGTLEIYLNRCRSILRDRFRDTVLIQPGAGTYRDGIFTYQVQVLTGSRHRFRRMTISTLMPLDTEKLYLYPREGGNPLELLPFFRLIIHPETRNPAWYFYNRMDGRDVRWVSYHYEAQPEFTEENEEVYTAMKTFGLILEEAPR